MAHNSASLNFINFLIEIQFDLIFFFHLNEETFLDLVV